MAQVTIDVDDDVLRLVDDVARRVGLPREAVLARAVRQETAASVLAELFQGHWDGLSDDEVEQIVDAERRNARRSPGRGSDPGVTAPRRVMPHRMVLDPHVFISALMAKPGIPT